MGTTDQRARSGWSLFLAWLLCGAVWIFSFLSFAGPFAWPIAILLTWFTVRRTVDRHDVIGLLAGVASFLLFVGFLHIADNPCPASGSGGTLTGGDSFSCGGLNSAPWLIVGGLLLVGSLLWYRTTRRRNPTAIDQPTATVLPPI